MKKTLLLFVTLYFSLSFGEGWGEAAYAQFTDTHWNLGRQTSLDFKTNPPTVNLSDSLFANTLTNTSTSICDRKGDLIFCTNALRVYNKNGHVMPNGSGFNQGTLINSYAVSGSYNPIFKGAITIPFPNDTNKLYVFYINMEWHIGINYLPEKLYYLVVDRTLDNGLGDVTIKDQILISNDTLSLGELMAIKHGNGKDWWLISRKYRSNMYYKFLIDSAGIHQKNQSIGSAFNDSINTYDCICNSTLDGEHLAYVKLGDSKGGQIDLLDFDRCTGALYNYKKIQTVIPKTSYFEIRSCCFSPSNRFLYVTDLDSLWQLDLTNVNIIANKIYLGKRHFNRQFFIMKNAPDGKIYMCHYGSFQNISMIEFPDKAGNLCNFLEDTVHFGTYANGPWADGGIPNMPNFALGKIDCGVGVQEVANTKEGLIIYPNPANTNLVIGYLKLEIGYLEITDLLGRVIKKITNIQQPITNIEINELPSGFYFIKATDEKGNVMNGKFVKE